MAFPINFKKQRIARLLDCLELGKPIEPSNEGGWTVNDMLILAGACLFGVASHGPVLVPGADTSSQSSERREFIEEQFMGDVRGALDFYGHVAMMLQDGDYDSHFGLEASGAIEFRDGEPTLIMPVHGFKPSQP